MSQLDYSIFPQYITGLTKTSDKLVNGSSTTYCYYTLSAVQKIAEALGDGFYAEEVSREDGIPIHWANNSSTILVDGSKSIPVLRHIKYGNVCIFFYTNTGSISSYAIGISVFDLVKGEAFACCELHTVGSGGEVEDNTSICIVNVSESKKMICASATLYSGGCIVLGDHIIVNRAHSGATSAPVITIIKSDGTKSETTYSATLPNRNGMQLLPLFAEGFPDVAFPGIYVLYRTIDGKSRGNYLYDGVVYFSPGAYTNNGSSSYIPILVISDEA